jgi:hypothetical protein
VPNSDLSPTGVVHDGLNRGSEVPCVGKSRLVAYKERGIHKFTENR